MTLCRSWRVPPPAYTGWAVRLVCGHQEGHGPPHRSREGWTWWSDGDAQAPASPVMVDTIAADGHHAYWSTHCRHGRHDACAAVELAPGVPRRPSQCKTCAAPCVCDCHRRSP